MLMKGLLLGKANGCCDWLPDGGLDGDTLGLFNGEALGLMEGLLLGEAEICLDGLVDGDLDGDLLG